MVVSPSEKVDGISSCYIVTTGDEVTTSVATTDKVSISSVAISGLVQFTGDHRTCLIDRIEQLQQCTA